MDKSWLDISNRSDQRYRDGVDNFLNWAFSQSGVSIIIRCLCKECRNTVFKLRIDVRLHLLNKRFCDSYRVWDYHGEVFISGENSNPAGSDQVEDDEIEHDNVIEMIHDACGHTNVDKTGQSSNPSEGLLQTQQIQRGPIQRTSPEAQSSRNLDESVRLSVEAETSAVSHINKKKGRGKYKFKTVDFKFKHGEKIKIMIPDDIDRAVDSGARDIVNYCGWIIRTIVSFRDRSWQNIFLKHGEEMWYRIKLSMRITSDGIFTNRQKIGCDDECFFSDNLHYCVEKPYPYLARVTCYNNDKDRLSHRPEDVELDDWKHLVEHFGSDKFKVLGEKSGYVRGKGYGKKPTKKNQTQQANIEASVSSAVESMRQEMQLDMERKLQEEREQMAVNLKRDMDQDLQKKLEEEREYEMRSRKNVSRKNGCSHGWNATGTFLSNSLSRKEP
ncbi:hypothetical protein FXO38_14694 [Capsicum annuum]|uniref:Transposase-associated domain-containing protein n=1 Tax=Capsicum annuum TaxID=4072 RepID=A0A2G2YWF3_CAPAN|nr:hypothetical protein FXO37_28472 [Capsicum annuum]KAF3655412.1 hypothetical protein FXO38_14694 [Capsicum annuum]PHT74069.1 hypothetical protein T459_21346 [Capsicum annuum]